MRPRPTTRTEAPARSCRVLSSVLVAALATGCQWGDPSDTLPEIALVPLSTIDSEAIPGQAPFGRIADLEIAEDGSVFVLDALSRDVRVFDQEGAPLRSFGTRGRGPGELERPAALFWGPAGNLWVADLGNGRFTVFDRDGALVGSYPAAGPPPVEPMSMGFSDTGVLRVVSLDFSRSFESPDALLVEYDVEGDQLAPLRQLPLPFVEWPDIYAYRGSDVTLMVPVPFSGHPTFGVDPGGRAYYAQTGGATIRRISFDADTEFEFGRSLASISLPQSEVDRALSDDPDLAEIRQLGGQASVAELTALIPETKPLLEGLFFDDEDRVWVVRTPSDPESGTRPIDVYDATGSIVGVTELPVVANPRPRVRDGLLVGVVRDDLDVESVALYRVRR